MAFRDWLNVLGLDRLTGKRGSWPWIAVLAAVVFLLLMVSTGSLSAVAELVRALAALCWPALVYVVLRTYQEEIRSLLHRIRRAKPGPGELELRAELDRLEQQVRTESESTPVRSVANADDEDVMARDASDERRILDAAARSPRLGLMELSLFIEQELRRLFAAAGGDTVPGLNGSPTRGLPEHLAERALLPRSLAGSVTTWADLRNRLVHAHAAHESETMRAIDVGTTILRILRAHKAQASSEPESHQAEGGMEQVARGV